MKQLKAYVPTLREVFEFLGNLFRMWPAWMASIALLLVMWYIAPQQIGVTVSKALAITLGGVLGFWVHVWTFGHIDDLPLSEYDNEKNRRAFLVGMGMLGFSLAV